MDVKMILETGDSWAIEEHFHDVKEVWGAQTAAGTQCVVEHWLLASEYLAEHKYLAVHKGGVGELGRSAGGGVGGPNRSPTFVLNMWTRVEDELALDTRDTLLRCVQLDLERAVVALLLKFRRLVRLSQFFLRLRETVEP